MLINCFLCEKIFDKPKSHINRTRRSFCSKECHDYFQKINHENHLIKNCLICQEEFKVRISESKRFVTCSKEFCRTENKSKSNNPNWSGGVTRDRKAVMSKKEYKIWRSQVFERDNFICQSCFKRGGTLHAHHIKPYFVYEELRFDINNGKTLCEACHKTTYGDVKKWKIIMIMKRLSTGWAQILTEL